MADALLAKSLGLLKAGDLKTGPEWEEAHEICQQHEGDPAFDWMHALIHRIEGDDANAAYWYRRAGRARHPGTVAEEWQTISDAVSGA